MIKPIGFIGSSFVGLKHIGNCSTVVKPFLCWSFQVWNSLKSVSARGGGRRLPASRRAAMYENSKRLTAILRSASRAAMVFMNGLVMAAPAPWARKQPPGCAGWAGLDEVWHRSDAVPHVVFGSYPRLCKVCLEWLFVRSW